MYFEIAPSSIRSINYTESTLFPTKGQLDIFNFILWPNKDYYYESGNK